MQPLYARVFVKILDSSLAEHWKARHVFEDILKLHTEGVLDMTRQALSRRINVPLDEVNSAIDILEAPDPNSRDEAEKGRRLVRLDEHRDWGWRIVNWEKYDSIRSQADEREQTAERVRRYRARKAAEKAQAPTYKPAGSLPPAPPTPEDQKRIDIEEGLPNRNGALQTVTPPLVLTSEAPAGAAASRRLLSPTEAGTAKWNIPPQLDREPFTSTWARWVAFRKTMKRVKDWETMFEAQLKRLSGLTPEVAAETLEKSISNGWQGLFPPDGTQPGANGSLPAWKLRQDLEHQIATLEDKARWMQDGPARAKLVAEIQELKRKVGA